MAYIPKQKRKTTTERGYGAGHQQARKRLIKLYPLCQVCNDEWSTQLHELDGNPFNTSPGNLYMVCDQCHLELHGRA